MWQPHYGLLKTGDGDGCQFWPRSATVDRVYEQLVKKTKSGAASEIMSGQRWKNTWNTQAFRWYGMLSSSSYGKLPSAYCTVHCGEHWLKYS